MVGGVHGVTRLAIVEDCHMKETRMIIIFGICRCYKVDKTSAKEKLQAIQITPLTAGGQPGL